MKKQVQIEGDVLAPRYEAVPAAASHDAEAQGAGEHALDAPLDMEQLVFQQLTPITQRHRMNARAVGARDIRTLVTDIIRYISGECEIPPTEKYRPQIIAAVQRFLAQRLFTGGDRLASAEGR